MTLMSEDKTPDPFAWMDGILDNEDPDLSARVDEILYGPQVDPHS